MINTNKVVDNLKVLGLLVAAMIIMVAFMAPVRIPEWVRTVTIVATVAVMLGVNIVYARKFGPGPGKKWSFDKPTDTRHRVQVTDLHHNPADRLEIHGIMPGTGERFEEAFCGYMVEVSNH